MPTLDAAVAMHGTAPTVDGIRLSLHVLAGAIWVGGQLTVGGLLPTVRRLGADAPRQVATAFARFMWPAFAVLVVTGIWNISAVGSGRTSAWQAVLGAKMAVVAVSGVAAYAHSRATTRRGLAVGGALAGVSSTAALLLGIFLAG